MVSFIFRRFDIKLIGLFAIYCEIIKKGIKRVKELQSSRSEEDTIPIEQLLEIEEIGGLQAAASNDLITEGNDFTMMVHHMLLKN